jgi:hypothetical protein
VQLFSQTGDVGRKDSRAEPAGFNERVGRLLEKGGNRHKISQLEQRKEEPPADISAHDHGLAQGHAVDCFTNPVAARTLARQDYLDGQRPVSAKLEDSS